MVAFNPFLVSPVISAVIRAACSVFLYLVVLWLFAVHVVKLLKSFSEFASMSSICMCSLKLQCIKQDVQIHCQGGVAPLCKMGFLC